MLKSADARSVLQFIWEELLSRYGVIEEIVTDNRPEFSKVIMSELLRCYSRRHIHISPYNSCANSHNAFQQTLIKMADEHNMENWMNLFHKALRVEHFTWVGLCLEIYSDGPSVAAGIIMVGMSLAVVSKAVGKGDINWDGAHCRQPLGGSSA